MPPFPVLLANRDRLTQTTVHESIHEWLAGRGGFRNVRFVPSKIRRNQVHADVDPEVAFGAVSSGTGADAATARLEVQFEFPEGVSYDYYRIQWVVPDRNYSVGWHQDDHRDDLGKCHLQFDYRDEVVDVSEADFLDAHPLNVLEARLRRLPDVLAGLSWDDGEPSFDP